VGGSALRGFCGWLEKSRDNKVGCVNHNAKHAERKMNKEKVELVKMMTECSGNKRAARKQKTKKHHCSCWEGSFAVESKERLGFLSPFSY